MELKRAGFSGVETSAFDSGDGYHVYLNMITRAAEIHASDEVLFSSPNVTKSEYITLLHRHEKLSLSVLEIVDLLEKDGFHIHHCTMNREIPHGQDIISLLEVE